MDSIFRAIPERNGIEFVLDCRRLPIQDLAIGGRDVSCVDDNWRALSRVRCGTHDGRRFWGALAEGFFPVVTTEEQASILFAASATEGLYAVQFAAGGAAAAAAT